MSDYAKDIRARVSFVSSCLNDLGIGINEQMPNERYLVVTTGFSRGKLREVFAVIDYLGYTQSSHGKARIVRKDLTGLIS